MWCVLFAACCTCLSRCWECCRCELPLLVCCRLYLSQAEIEADRNRWVRCRLNCSSAALTAHLPLMLCVVVQLAALGILAHIAARSTQSLPFCRHPATAAA